MKRDGCFAGRAAWTRRALVAAAGAVALSPAGAARADVDFLNSSDVTFRHDPDRESSAVAPRTLEVSSIPTSSNLLSFQLNNTFTSGLANTRAVGGFGHVTNPTTATFVIKPGTGVTQDDPGNAAYPGSSSLKINIDTIWDVDSDGFGPLATGYISLAVGGVVGDGGSAKFIANLQFTEAVTNTPLRSDWVVNRTFSDPGAFAKTFTTSEVLASSPSTLGTLSGSQRLRVKGYIEFRASNAETPSSIEPLEMEIGGAPPTGSWTGAGANQNWTNPDNWITPDEPNPVLLPVVPNSSGHRARFISRDGAPRVVNVDQPVKIGTLDVDGVGAFVFQGEKITFDTLGGPAVFNVRNVQGAQEHRMNAVTELLRPLEITTDATTRLNLAGAVNGPGMSLTKFGDGRVRLGAPNGYTGGTLVRGGVLAADAEGALGTGPVNVQNSMLEYNALRAIASSQLVTVAGGGTVQLGVVPTSADRFSVLDGGSISGSSVQLRALTVGGNLTLQPGAVIANTDLSDLAADMPGNLGTTPQYLFGLSKTELQRDFTLGLATTTAWRGLASSVGNVTLGTSARTLSLAGQADLLVPANGTLTIGSKVAAVSGTPTLLKTGAGTAVLASTENTVFNSTVRAGTLTVNGTHPGIVTVEQGGVLGGTGTVGTVQLPVGGHIAPGASIGQLTVEKLELAPTSELDFEFAAVGNNDTMVVRNELILDGKLNVIAGENFGPGRYGLILQPQTGVVDRGVEVGQAPGEYAYNILTIPFIFNTRLLVMDVVRREWNVDGGGDWGAAANWAGPVPDGVGARASFLQRRTAAGIPGPVLLNGTRTVGRMEFDNDVGYRIEPGTGGGSLVFDNGGAGALLEVNAGRHAITPFVTARDDLDVDVQDTAALSGINAITVETGKTLRKVGLGELSIDGGIWLQTGARLLANQGTVRTDYVLGGSVTIRDGALLQINGDGTNAGSSKVNGLTFEGTSNAWRGRLDLKDNDLVVQATAATRQTVLAEVTNQLKAARGAGRTLWDNEGIGTSSATTVISLAVALNDRGDGTPLYTSFGGLPVDVNSVIVKYTYNGDANLDGRINADDYFRIDLGFLTQPAIPSYRQGDFNYDGRINADDYFQIDRSFLGQGAALDSGATVSAVPEPATLAAIGVACAASTLRCCRRRRAPRSRAPVNPSSPSAGARHL